MRELFMNSRREISIQQTLPSNDGKRKYFGGWLKKWEHTACEQLKSADPQNESSSNPWTEPGQIPGCSK
jgi:hypothetical protein